MQPLIRTETYTGPQGRKPQAVVIAAPGIGPQFSQLQTKLLDRPRKTETKAVTRGCWGPGVLLRKRLLQLVEGIWNPPLHVLTMADTAWCSYSQVCKGMGDIGGAGGVRGIQQTSPEPHTGQHSLSPRSLSPLPKADQFEFTIQEEWIARVEKRFGNCTPTLQERNLDPFVPLWGEQNDSKN